MKRITLWRHWRMQGRALLALGLLSTLTPPVTAKEPIGEVQLARGGALAEQASLPARLLGRDSEILLGDALSTSDESFLVMRLADDSKLSLRPASRLTIEAFDASTGKGQAQLYLERGGLQSESGRISRQGPGRYRLRTPHGDMQVNGARFSARLCDGDCEDSVAAAPTTPGRAVPDGKPAARVVKQRGSARVESQGRQYPLSQGSPLYPGDIVVTDERSDLAMAFRDGGRISLIENSRFVIQAFRYEGDAQHPTSQGQANYQLLEGGLRALSGYIGKGDEGDYALATPVSVIGVRGTGFDAICRGDCQGDAVSAADLDAATAEGLFVRVWADAIVLQVAGRAYEYQSGQSAYVANRDMLPIEMVKIPSFLQFPAVPRPDTLKVDMKAQFAASPQKAQPTGLYVNIEEGSVRLSEGGKVLSLVAGQSGYVGPSGVYRLPRPLSFQLDTAAPQPWQPQETLLREHSLLSDDASFTSNFSCKVQ